MKKPSWFNIQNKGGWVILKKLYFFREYKNYMKNLCFKHKKERKKNAQFFFILIDFNY